jgi:hypothetical protein
MNDFATLIDFFKINRAEYNSNQARFHKLLFEFKELQINLEKNDETTSNRLNNFLALINDYSTLSKAVYENRYNETAELLTANQHEISFSSFELMEHDYRENSHSNILRHIFHHKFWDLGKVILAKFVERVTNDDIIPNLIMKSNYEIHREFFTKTGRIDLLIEDKKNNFVIVIENKVLASIAVKEYSEDKTISKTQLHNYSNFITANYSNFHSSFILLSLYPDTTSELEQFKQTDYTALLEILNETVTDNNIVNDYKILLKSLTNYLYDKEWLIELNNKFKRKSKIYTLNTFEIANKYFQ